MATPVVDEAAPSPRAGVVPMLAVGVVALAAGAGVGRLVVAPRLAPSSAAASAAADEGKSGPVAAMHQFRIDGVIVNPAGTRGQHHLIVSVAFEVAEVKDHDALKAAEVALRDRIGSLLEQRTVDALSAPGVRDLLRGELAALAAEYVQGRPVQVYLPQYILQ